jgi:hypothetical protein
MQSEQEELGVNHTPLVGPKEFDFRLNPNS